MIMVVVVMKEFRFKEVYLLFFYFLASLFLEISFEFLTGHSVFQKNILFLLFSSMCIACIFTLITLFLPKKIQRIFFIVVLFLFGLWFCIQFYVFKMFGFYFNFSLLSAAGQVAEFSKDGVQLIFHHFLGIIFFFFPAVLAILFYRHLPVMQRNWLEAGVYLVLGIFCFANFHLLLYFPKGEEYELFYDVNNPELTIQKMGVFSSLSLDLKRTIFGFSEKIHFDLSHSDNQEPEKEEPIVYEPNYLDYDFDSLIQATTNSNIRSMHEYFKNEKGTLKNEYTGMFAGKNLILFMAESFNEIAVREDLTPTLYQLVNHGFVFQNYYTPTISSTIGGEFQELTGMIAASGFLSPWKSGKNSFPFGIATSFEQKGYQTFAYHDNSVYFQNRNQYLAALGFHNFKGCRNGLENLMNCNRWPASDIDMIDVTASDFLSSPSDQPFFTYYVTVSGHGNYEWSGNSIATKRRKEVEHLPYSEKVKAYLATQIELDHALELLIQKLEEAGVLEDTVIALVGDHYPYYLSIDEVNEVASYQKDSVVEVNRSNFILWNSEMDKIEIDKVGSQIDVLPTLYNLFGIDYDSRVIIGKDILSTEPGLAIFENRSWVSDYGTYFASTGQFVLKDGMTVEDDYVSYMKKVVQNRMNMSKMIMENNYYQYLNP